MKFLLVVTGIALLAACGSSSKSSSGGSATQTLSITITKNGCPPPATAKAGKTKFTVTNNGAGNISEVELMSGSKIVGEKEDLAPGLTGSFTVTLQPGAYTTKCPGGQGGTLTVSS